MIKNLRLVAIALLFSLGLSAVMVWSYTSWKEYTANQNPNTATQDEIKLFKFKKNWENQPANAPILENNLKNLDTLTLDPKDITVVSEHFINSIFASTPLDPKALPQSVLDHKQALLVFATALEGNQKKYFFSTGKGILQTLQNLAKQIQTRNITALKIDFLKTVYNKREFKSLLHNENELGLFGLVFFNPYPQVILPEEVRVYPQFIKSALTTSSVLGFTTQSFFAEKQNPVASGEKNHIEFYPLYRGHRLYTHITNDILKSSIKLATDYLIKHIRSNGRFDYLYEPATQTIPKKYNLVRHAGTIYALLDVYKTFPDEDLLHNINLALDYLLEKTAPCPSQGSAICVIEKNKVKLGGNALALLAFAKHAQITHSKNYWPQMRGLAQAILQMQKTNGDFVFEWNAKNGKTTDFVSEYYPGEATLALVELYKIDPNPAWLLGAQKAVSYIALERDINLTPTTITHDHWMLIAINELNKIDPQPYYKDHAKKIVLAIQNSQIQNSAFIDFNGGYYNPPQSTPAAVRTEGLIAFYEMWKKENDPEFSKRILETIQKNLAFQLQTQILTENSLGFNKNKSGYGGFQESVLNTKIRIDYVQHNLSGLIGYLRILSTASDQQ